MSWKFNLGDLVKDRVTGFEGIVAVRSEYMTGCDRYGIQNQKLKDGRPTEWIHFDENVLDLVKSEVIQLNKTEAVGGAINLNQEAPQF